MTRFILLLSAITLSAFTYSSAQETTKVHHFEKVIVSPHVEATLTQGDDEAVTVLSSTVSADKIHIESKNNVLRVYLEGAKEVTKSEKQREKAEEQGKTSLYNGTVLKVAISYKTLLELSVRGGEEIAVKSKIDQDEFTLTLYGETNVNFLEEVQLQKMHTTMYGTCQLDFKSGNIDEHRFTLYGESKANTLNLSNKITRCTIYGESDLRLNVSDLLKVTAFGEAKVGYKGDPDVKKGIHIGELKVYKLD